MARSTNLERLLVNDQLTKTGSYDNNTSGLTSDNVKGAIDEVVNKVEVIENWDAEDIPVSFSPSNYSPVNANVDSHLSALNTEIGSLKTQLIGGVNYKGGYDPTSNAPALDQSKVQEDPYASGIQVGDMYTVTADGSFYGQNVTIGDVIIAEINDPTTADDWTVVENNLEDAADVSFTNAGTGISATDVQTAITEVSNSYKAEDTLLKNRLTALEGVSHDAVTLGASKNGLNISDQEIQLALASATSAGALSADDKSKLDAIEEGAKKNQTRVFSRTSDFDISSLTIEEEFITVNNNTNSPITVTYTGGNTIELKEYQWEIFHNFNTGTNLPSVWYPVNKTDSLAATEVSYAGLDGSLTESNTTVAAAISTLDSAIKSNDSDITSLDTRIDDLEDDTHAKAVSGNAAISVDETTQAVSAVVSSDPNNKISIDANGLFVNQRADEVSVTESDYYSYSHVQSAIDGLARNVFESPIVRRSVSGPITLTYKDPKYQHFVVSANVVASLPSNPIQGRHFVIKNSPSSSHTLYCNSVPVAPGEIYEIIYDGTEWVEW